MLDPQSPEKKAAFFREAEGYREDFSDHAYFVAVARTGEYFFNDPSKPFSDQPRYVLSETDPVDAWFRKSLVLPDDYNIDVNIDVRLKETHVWMNMLVRNAGQGIGVIGASLIQCAFLPARQMTQSLSEHHFVLGQPCDVLRPPTCFPPISR